MFDGQLLSHLVEVFTTAEISAERHPRLQLALSHALTHKNPNEDQWFSARTVAPNQSRSIEVEGVSVERRGTVLLFDLDQFPAQNWKPMVRVRAILSWNRASEQCDAKDPDSKACHKLAAAEEVVLGQIVPAGVWALAIISLIVSLVAALGWVSRRRDPSRGLLWIVRSSGGRASLSRVQAVLWTLAIGWVVTMFGFVLPGMPAFPWQVAALLGLSLGTGMVSFGKEMSDASPAAPTLSPSFADLICEDDGTPSLARVQMLAWTIITLLLFISKSILQSRVWEVPPELVVLMGLSQVGYLVPKWLEPNTKASGMP